MGGLWQPKTAWALALCAMAGPAAAGDVVVQVSGLRTTDGLIGAQVCTEDAFTTPACAWSGYAPAAEGRVVIEDVPPGRYAVQAIHDENGNRALDRPGFLPLEGMGFSRDAPMRMGPPAFDDAAFDLTDAGATVPLTMRYFQ